MRRLAFIIANFLMKLFNKNHRFRFIAFFILQMIISQSIQVAIIFTIGYFLHIVNYIWLTFLFFYISKFIFGGYHASSFESCTIMSTTIIIIPSLMSSYNIYFGIGMIMLVNMFASTNYGENKLDKVSQTIDNVFKKRR